MRFNFLLVSAAIALAASTVFTSCSSEVTRFAVTDMTWAEFYAGELGTTVAQLEANGYDAVTSATARKTKNYSQAVVSEDGAHIYGPKNVAVGMTESVYKKLSAEQKARFTFIEDSTFVGCKVMDKKGNFSAYMSDVKTVSDAQVRISSGNASSWGNYTISVGNVNIGGGYHGVVLTADDGSKYGLKCLDNIWLRETELAFNVVEFKTRNGNNPGHKHTAGLEGKTITNITYIISGGEAVSIDTDLLVKKQNGASVTVDGEVAFGQDAKVVLNGLPEGYEVSSLMTGQGRQMEELAKDKYTLDGDVLTLIGVAAPGNYRVSLVSPEYVDITASFVVK